MTGVSIQMQRGQSGFRLDDFTVGTTAPASLDMMVSYQLLDTNSNPLTREDIILFIKAVIRLLMQNGLQSPLGTFVQPGPGI
jgi:hypothetical protein